MAPDQIEGRRVEGEEEVWGGTRRRGMVALGGDGDRIQRAAPAIELGEGLFQDQRQPRLIPLRPGGKSRDEWS